MDFKDSVMAVIEGGQWSEREDKLRVDEQDAVSLTACKGAEATAEDAVVDIIDRRFIRV